MRMVRMMNTEKTWRYWLLRLIFGQCMVVYNMRIRPQDEFRGTLLGGQDGDMIAHCEFMLVEDTVTIERTSCPKP